MLAASICMRTLKSFSFTISANTYNPDIPALAVAAGWNGASALVVDITAALINTINIQSGWSFPGGLAVNISAGTRVGGIGGGTVAGTYSGGNAFTTAKPVTVNNLGIISGGGGAGPDEYDGYWFAYQDGIGAPLIGQNGSPGNGQGFAGSLLVIVPENSTGPTGGSTQTYSGSVLGGTTPAFAAGDGGGVGGTWGADGGSFLAGERFGGYGGTNATGGSSKPSYPGRPAGKAVVGNSNITWLSTGTRLGPIT